MCVFNNIYANMCVFDETNKKRDHQFERKWATWKGWVGGREELE